MRLLSDDATRITGVTMPGSAVGCLVEEADGGAAPRGAGRSHAVVRGSCQARHVPRRRQTGKERAAAPLARAAARTDWKVEARALRPFPATHPARRVLNRSAPAAPA